MNCMVVGLNLYNYMCTCTVDHDYMDFNDMRARYFMVHLFISYASAYTVIRAFLNVELYALLTSFFYHLQFIWQ